MNLAKKGKLQLIRGAARRGPVVLVRQLWLALMDSFVRKRHLVFRLGATSCAAQSQAGQDVQQVREIRSREDLTSDELASLTDPEAAHDWGMLEWLDAGWQLWVLTEEGRIQAVAWVRDAAHSRDFFVPLTDTEELFWHVYVLPRYRGRNLQGRLWDTIVASKISAGIDGFYTNCRDYNLPSRLNILKTGFSPVGHCNEYRLTHHRTWRQY
jgi:GNAT superfamily N-acetyltransferase